MKDSITIKESIKKAESIELTEDAFHEYLVEATNVYNKSIREMKSHLDDVEKNEAERTELERLRELEALREKERIEEAEKLRKEKELAEKQEMEKKNALMEAKKAKELKVKQEADALAAKKNAEEREKEIAKKHEEEIKAKEIEAREAAKKAADDAAKKERDKLAADKLAAEQDEIRREADIAHRRKINNVILDGLVEVCGLSEDQAKNVIRCVANKEIENIKITY